MSILLRPDNSHFKINTTENQSYSLLMGLVTVLLFYLTFPGVGFAEFTWIAIVPVLIALNKMSLRNAFVLGLLTATLGWMSSIWWAVNGVAEITSASPNLVLPFVFVFCLLSALPYACACWIHVRCKFGESLSGAFLSATFFTVLVNYIPNILPGNLAHALYLQPLFIQLADMGGVALVFFLIHCINILIANGITLVRTSKTKAMHCFVMALVLFIGNIGYGYYKKDISHSPSAGQLKALRLVILQPNIDVTNRTRIDWMKEQENLSSLLVKVNEEQGVDLIIFPEVPVPISYRYYEKDKAFFNQFLTDTPLLLTAISPLNETTENRDSYFNTMELIEKGGVEQDYAKQMLLPFGEYLPYEEQLPWLRNIFPFAPNYKPGENSTLFAIKNSQGETIKAIPLICYEAVFSDHVAIGVAQGGEFMINSSNDAWFNQLSGKRVHLALSLFRSVEYRKYLIRATNTGMSVVTNSYGDIVEGSQMSSNTQGYSVIDIPIEKQISFYQQFPNIVKVIFLLICLLFIIHSRTKTCRPLMNK